MCSTLFGASSGKNWISKLPLAVSTSTTGGGAAAGVCGGAAADRAVTTPSSAVVIRSIASLPFLRHADSRTEPADCAAAAERIDRPADVLSPGHEIEIYDR